MRHSLFFIESKTEKDQQNMITLMNTDIKINLGIKKLLVLLIISSASYCGLYSQDKIIEGRVISEYFDILTVLSISINDTIEVGTPNSEGFFKVEIPISEEEISFKGLGLEPTTVKLGDKCAKVEIVMMLLGTNDFMTLRRSERERKRRFKKLSVLHKQAFNKGIFETERPCYNREFEPFYLK
ncbi:MAG: hypothetical protein AAFQ92_23360 [Bacteroidota bacterium]